MEKRIKVYWLVIVVIVLLSVFVFIQTSNTNSNLVQYFSFAGSITSLVLGLIAIFFSIVANQESTSNFGRLKEAVIKIEEGADTIKSVSDNINSRLDQISDEIVNFGTKSNANQTTQASELVFEKPVEPDPSADLPDEDNEGEVINNNKQDE